MDETTPILNNKVDGDSTENIYYGAGESPPQRCGIIVFTVVAVLASLVCLGLCIYQGAEKKVIHAAYPFLYFMFGANIVCVAAVHIIMVVFMKKGFISESKIWFSYISAVGVVLQSVLIDIVVMI